MCFPYFPSRVGRTRDGAPGLGCPDNRVMVTTGITVGVTTVLSHEGNDIAGRAFFTYGHITWRRRWLQSDAHGSVHVGLGVGPTVAWETYSDGEAGLKGRFLWHAELYFTRRVRGGLSLRGGIAFTPIPCLPPLLTAQTVLMAVCKL